MPTNEQNTEIIEAEQKRCIEITKVVLEAGLDFDSVQRFIENGKGPEQVKEIMEMYKRGIVRSEKATFNSRVENVVDEADKRRGLIEAAIFDKMGCAVDKSNAEILKYRHMDLMQLAAEYLPEHRFDSKYDLAKRVLTTTDFPVLLGNAAQRKVMTAYKTLAQTFTPFVSVEELPDFKNVERIQFGANPLLEKVNEGAEYKYDSISDATKEVYSVSKYGKIIKVTEEVLVNDSLGMISKLLNNFGVQASLLESNLVYNILLKDHLMGDGKTLFCKEHGNLADKGSEINDDSLSLGREAMRIQKHGENYLNLYPKFIIAGPANEQKILKMLASINPIKTEDVNTFGSSLIPIIDPRINDKSWFLVCDPAIIDLIEMGYLKGKTGPITEYRHGFEVDGLELKLKHIVGVKALDYRGFYKNPGIK